jgi:hypothetical protein
MGNTLQPNPSNAADDLVQPDWNSKHGEGTAPAGDDSAEFSDIYEKQREGAKQRLEDKKD